MRARQERDRGRAEIAPIVSISSGRFVLLGFGARYAPLRHVRPHAAPQTGGACVMRPRRCIFLVACRTMGDVVELFAGLNEIDWFRYCCAASSMPIRPCARSRSTACTVRCTTRATSIRARSRRSRSCCASPIIRTRLAAPTSFVCWPASAPPRGPPSCRGLTGKRTGRSRPRGLYGTAA
jgi:hypothetical protein